jgi:hypothetical protein
MENKSKEMIIYELQCARDKAMDEGNYELSEALIARIMIELMSE